MQTIDAFVSRSPLTPPSWRQRLEDIRELCDLSLEARSRLLHIHDEPVHDKPGPLAPPAALPRRTWLDWRHRRR